MPKLSQILPISPSLSPAGALLRLAAIGAIFAVVIGAFAYTGGWLTPHRLTPAALTDRLQQGAGEHPGFRRNHAKGVCITGEFAANGAGAALSKAAIFQSGTIPVIGRFSFGGGLPDAPDSPTNVRGLGLLLKTSDGQEWRTGMVNLPVFPVSTPKAFYDLLLASAPDKATGKPDPEKMKAFLGKYPDTAKAFGIIQSHPPTSGFADTTFYSLNAFRFTNSGGETAWVRWSFVPVQSVVAANLSGGPQTDKNSFFDALIAAIHAHPLQWHLVVTIAQPGDPTENATLPWAAGRQTVDCGTLTIDQIESDDTSPARDLNFDPLILPTGISPSDDPLLSARSAVYSQSFTRREGEPKTPAAVSAAETGAQP
jgi:catalase